MIKIIISDPDVFARAGIRQMLATQTDIRVVHEASTIADTLQGLRDVRADVCLLEANMARYSGLGGVRALRDWDASLPVLVISHCHERDLALRAIRAGAAGYLSKDCSAEQLALALRTAAGRRPYVSDTVCEMIVESLGASRPARPHDNLSDTDFDIFCLMAECIPIAKIAGICKLSVNAVRARRARIMERMSLHSDAELVEYAIRRKLIGQSSSIP